MWPITDWDVVLKWLFDRVVGAIALIAASPIMLLTALAIKLDSRGPVFFKQKRYGFNNELIEVYKFRSMHVDRCDATAARLVSKGDPRVTRIGAFIRKASIDELPVNAGIKMHRLGGVKMHHGPDATTAVFSGTGKFGA